MAVALDVVGCDKPPNVQPGANFTVTMAVKNISPDVNTPGVDQKATLDSMVFTFRYPDGETNDIESWPEEKRVSKAVGVVLDPREVRTFDFTLTAPTRDDEYVLGYLPKETLFE